MMPYRSHAPVKLQRRKPVPKTAAAAPEPGWSAPAAFPFAKPTLADMWRMGWKLPHPATDLLLAVDAPEPAAGEVA